MLAKPNETVEEKKITTFLELMTYLHAEAKKAPPRLTRDVWTLIFLTYLLEKDLDNARLSCRYLFHALNPIWENRKRKGSLYHSAATAIGVSYFVKLDRRVYGSTYLDIAMSKPKEPVEQCLVNGRTKKPHPVTNFKKLQFLSVISFSGHAHQVSLFEIAKNNFLCAVEGSNQYGQACGPDIDPTGLTEQQQEEAREKSFLKKRHRVQLLGGLRVITAACGAFHTILITDEGRVFACGKNSCGQLGLGHDNDQYGLVEVLFDEPIIAAAGGSEHTLFLGKSGKVYGSGRNSGGQLGELKEEYINKPVLLKTPDNIVKVFAGYDNSFLIDKEGHLHESGRNEHAQLGMGDYTDRHRFVTVHNLPPMESISASAFHTIGISREHRLYGCGKSDKQELCVKENYVLRWRELDKRYLEFKKMIEARKPIPSPIVDIKDLLVRLLKIFKDSTSLYAKTTGNGLRSIFTSAPRTEAALVLHGKIRSLSDKINDLATTDKSVIANMDKERAKQAKLIMEALVNNTKIDKVCELLIACLDDPVFTYIANRSALQFLAQSINQDRSLVNSIYKMADIKDCPQMSSKDFEDEVQLGNLRVFLRSALQKIKHGYERGEITELNKYCDDALSDVKQSLLK